MTARIFALLAAACLTTACGLDCTQVKSDRQAYLGRKIKATGPHLAALIPFKTINAQLDEHVPTVKTPALSIPGLGRIGEFIGKLQLSVGNIKVVPAKADRIGIRVNLELIRNDTKLFDLSLNTSLQPEVDPKKGKLALVLRADDLENIDAEIEGGATDKLTNAVYGRIPSAVRLIIKKRDVQGVAKKVTDWLVGETPKLVRQHFASKLSEIARFEFRLPDLPLASLSLRSIGGKDGHLQVGLRTSLAVEGHLSDRVPKMPDSKKMYVRVAGGTVAAIANWAIQKAMIPMRYDSNGKPKKNGDFLPAVAWGSGQPRPLKVLVWRETAPCCQVRIGGRPSVKLKKGKLDVKIEGGQIEEMNGPPLLQMGVWLVNMWTDSVSVSKKLTAATNVKIAGRKVRFGLGHAEVTGDELIIGFEIGASHNTSQRKKKGQAVRPAEPQATPSQT